MMIIHCLGKFEKRRHKSEKSIIELIEETYYRNSDYSTQRNASKDGFRKILNQNFLESDFRLLEIENIFGEVIAFDKVHKYYIFHSDNDSITSNTSKVFNIIIFSDDSNIIESINKTRLDIITKLKAMIIFELETGSTCTLYPYDIQQKYKYELDKTLKLEIMVKKEKNKVPFWRNILLTILLIPSIITCFYTENGWQALFINISWGICFFFITDVITKFFESKNEKEIVYIADISGIISNYHKNISKEIEQMDKIETVIPLRRV
ncbi:MAG: hypothetical protein ACQEXE_20140 [Bacillota bacterium]